ncbi:NADH:flavin oxidoreductase/NADH oxidase [Microdochium trichocladiopsis]|uniref:NADH:flavin oxidoreductase/NADH oxidase n=1 Tax=Microdochium trichocladiopsis TaxID=1682393 RepID=A0A9P8Y0L0_9PEZI|nr:NADH:flavin oxidoreductase/NADH oxidase [Microdochium trichocladiopsis]KAH7026523.1 NADH:flavin oxidoreductase/NADH oxidase [Microdochium trichocladiopsis]
MTVVKADHVTKSGAAVLSFTPVPASPIGAALDPENAPTLFKPLKMRGVTLHNRFAVAPMCQYSAFDGHLTDWHFAHLSQYMIRGNALTIVEATSVTPNGRISPEDSGLWQDSQIEPLRRLANFAHSQGQKFGIQLAHAGRKASTASPWQPPRDVGRITAGPEHGGWPDNVWAPSAIPFDHQYPSPKEMTLDDIRTLLQAFKDAARRAVAAGIDVIEIHSAHGYLLTEFLSPTSNKRTDHYGGSFENRTRLLLEVIAGVREVIPETMPLWVRISATGWMEYTGEPSWTIEDTIKLAKLLPAAGVDLLDVSSGGNNAAAKISMHTYYQIDLAGKIRQAIKEAGLDLLIGAVGMITEAEMARSIVQETGSGSGKPAEASNGTVEVEEESGATTQADVVLIGRQLLREPEFPLRVAHKLGVPVVWPKQYMRAGWRREQQL